VVFRPQALLVRLWATPVLLCLTKSRLWIGAMSFSTFHNRPELSQALPTLSPHSPSARHRAKKRFSTRFTPATTTT